MEAVAGLDLCVGPSEIYCLLGLPRAAVQRRVSEYSKGMRQKVGIAIAIAKEADALLLDEPTSGLDPQASNEFSELLGRLRDRGVAVLLATHDLFRAKETGTRVGIMRHGRLVTEMSTDEIGHADLERIYLEHMHGVRGRAMIKHIVRKEFTDVVRDGRFRWCAALVGALLLVSLGHGWVQARQAQEELAAAQATARDHWESQGEKNPHSAAHYGIYAFKPRLALSFVDEGVDPYTGTSVWLEAHRQNDFLMRPAQDATSAQRVGALTAAQVLQHLVPLLTDRAALTESLLAEHGVERVEDLPLNEVGVYLQESEEFGNRIFDRNYGALWDTFERQGLVHEALAAAAPLLAVRTLSMGLAGTDVEQHRHFATAAEAYRRDLMRRMNGDLAENSRTGELYTAGPDLWPRVPPHGMAWERFQEGTVEAARTGNAERVQALEQELADIANGGRPSSGGFGTSGRVLLWCATVTLYALFWFALAAWVNSLRRSSAWNATVLVGAWLVLVVVLPAAVNIAAGLLHPLPSRVEMITAQREASNEAVNRRSELLARYLEDHPEMAGGVVAEESGRAALAWAATDAVNQRLEEVTAVHDARRAEQLALVRRYRFLSPALLAQEVLVDAAGTGDARFARFQSQVRAFAEEWRQFFVPAILAGDQMTAAVLPDVPAFRFVDEDSSDVAGRAAVPLTVLGGLVALVIAGAGAGLGKVRGAD